MKRLLLVEDEADLGVVLRDLLEMEGYEVVLAYDGREALQAVARQRPDLVITDIMMPFVDGYELIERLRGDGETRELPIIAMSATERSGHRPFLRKPIDFSLLLATIDRELQPSPS